MQSTLPLQPSHPLKSLVGLARQIALPHEYAAQRLPSFPALERTAVMAFSAPTTLVLPASTPIQVNVMRQAAYPVWASQDVSTTVTGYAIGFQTESHVVQTTSAGDTYNVNMAPRVSILSNANASNSFIGVSGITNSSPWGAPLIGVDSTKVYMYKPTGIPLSVVVASSSALPATTSLRVEICAWTSPGEEIVVDSLSLIIAAGNTGAFGSSGAATNYNWLRFSVVNVTPTVSEQLPASFFLYGIVGFGTVTYTGSTTSQGTVVLPVATGRYVFPLVSPSEFYNAPLPWFATRTTACSFLGTNVSQVLVKGGTILAGRLSPAVVSPWQVTSSYIMGLHPAEKAYLALETGVYTYVPPSTDLQNFTDYTNTPMYTWVGSTATGGVLFPNYQLGNDSLYHTMFITATSTDEQLACTVDWHLEFRTSSALFQIGMSTMALETLHQAQLSLAELGYFFENPDHKKLKEKLARVVSKYGPKALSVGSMIPGPVGTVAKAAQFIVSARNRPPPSTTTAAASGMGKQGQRKKAKQKGKKKK